MGPLSIHPAAPEGVNECRASEYSDFQVRTWRTSEFWLQLLGNYLELGLFLKTGQQLKLGLGPGFVTGCETAPHPVPSHRARSYFKKIWFRCPVGYRIVQGVGAERVLLILLLFLVLDFVLHKGVRPKFNFFCVAMSHFDWPITQKGTQTKEETLKSPHTPTPTPTPPNRLAFVGRSPECLLNVPPMSYLWKAENFGQSTWDRSIMLLFKPSWGRRFRQ